MKSRRRAGLWGAGRAKSERGQALAEFALAFPLQLFVVFGIMQLILLYVSSLTVNYASYKACRASVVGDDPRIAASIVLAPLGGMSLDEADKAEVDGLGVTVTIPGWGELKNQDLAYAKTLAYKYEGDDADDDARTIIVEFDQELYFPVVDAMMALFLGAERPEDKTAFGTLDDSAGRSGYLDREAAYDFSTKKLKDGRERVRLIGGTYHYLITRECTLYEKYTADYTEKGSIMTGKGE